MDRYHRQILLPQIGRDGQAKLLASRVAIVGCGALGSGIAEWLARAGVGFLRLVDRDIVEETNLQRQLLFTEADAKHGVPKAVAAARRLRQINSQITVEENPLDIDATNIEQMLSVGDAPVDLVLDGTDNIDTRYLINDAAVKHSIPWIYGGCVAFTGRVMMIRPGQTSCLRCVFEQLPKGAEMETCDTAGVLGPAAGVVASMQALAAIKFLTGNIAAVGEQLLAMDFWTNRVTTIDLSQARRADCICCGKHRFDFLESSAGASAIKLCGRSAVQVKGACGSADLQSLAHRLARAGAVETSPFFVRATLDDPPGIAMTIFPDGRAIIAGTTDLGRARAIYSRFIGN